MGQVLTYFTTLIVHLFIAMIYKRIPYTKERN
jgi:hypothetical protein